MAEVDPHRTRNRNSPAGEFDALGASLASFPMPLQATGRLMRCQRSGLPPLCRGGGWPPSGSDVRTLEPAGAGHSDHCGPGFAEQRSMPVEGMLSLPLLCFTGPGESRSPAKDWKSRAREGLRNQPMQSSVRIRGKLRWDAASQGGVQLSTINVDVDRLISPCESGVQAKDVGRGAR